MWHCGGWRSPGETPAGVRNGAKSLVTKHLVVQDRTLQADWMSILIPSPLLTPPVSILLPPTCPLVTVAAGGFLAFFFCFSCSASHARYDSRATLG